MPESELSRDKILRITLSIATIGISAASVLFFFPGALSWDPWSFQEATSWTFEGHQKPMAAVVLWLFGFGSPVAAAFILKSAAWTAGVVFCIWKCSPRVAGPVAVFLLLANPWVIYHLPALRLNTLSATYIMAGLSFGLFGRSRVSAALAIFFLVLSTLLSSGMYVGQLFALMAVATVRLPDSSTAIRFSASAAVLGLVLAVEFVAASALNFPGRESTLVISHLNDVAALQLLTDTECLNQTIFRSPDERSTPLEYLKSARPEFGSLREQLWGPAAKFKDPPDVLDPVLYAHIKACKWQLVRAFPREYAAYKMKFMRRSFTSRNIDIYPAYDSSFNLIRPETETAIDRLGRSFKDYHIAATRLVGITDQMLALLLFVLTAGFACAGRNASLRPFAAIFAASLIGYLIPTALLGQAPAHRYLLDFTFAANVYTAFLISRIDWAHTLNRIRFWKNARGRRPSSVARDRPFG